MGIFDRFRNRSAGRSQHGFLQLAHDVACRLPEVADVERAQDHDFALRVTFHSKGAETVFLASPFHAARRMPRRQQERVVAKFLRHLGSKDSVPEDWETAQTRIFLALRPLDYPAASLGLASPVWQPVLDGLAHMLFIDLDTTVSGVNEEQLRTWGVSITEAWNVALHNTRQLAPDVEPPEAGTLLGIESGQLDAASSLAAPGWLSGIAGGRDVIAWVSDRDRAMVLVDPSGADLANLARLAREEWEQSPRGVSPRLYTLDGERVVPLTVAGDDVAHEELSLARYAQQLSACNAQKEALDRMHDDEGLDIWVGNLIVTEDEGDLRSVAVWTDRCDSLLPAADAFRFVGIGPDDQAEEVFELPQAPVVEAAGLRPVEGLLPTRYRVERWPDRETLDRLRRRAPLSGE